jgi:hypothetical protein
MREAVSLLLRTVVIALLALSAVAHFRAGLCSPPDLRIEAQVARLAPLRDLPLDLHIGYWCAEPPPKLDTTSPTCVDSFRMTRYALAPRIVLWGAESDWVIGDFDPAYRFESLAEARNLVIVRNYGNGLVLFRRKR